MDGVGKAVSLVWRTALEPPLRSLDWRDNKRLSGFLESHLLDRVGKLDLWRDFQRLLTSGFEKSGQKKHYGNLRPSLCLVNGLGPNWCLFDELYMVR